ncbi:N-methylhydantoinase B [Sporobacter termitidis DSM 10068]|uniref:N-methylhydantoinase B n=1 Tax=Sporobacter termitidis DSM 10068 TaxID=1123282 RepID=A0A1M5XCV4_9FIRM|nr:hydantoinase B/oxoprolinase family protein [Sporobacter termitidis]SHH97033.1 N-methylhydantoinase B [Sporobacter termitidis DSM 10068]
MKTEAADLEIIRNYFSAICCGMGYVIERTSYSSYVTESADYATALATPEGDFFAYPKTAGVTNFMGLSLNRAIAECGGNGAMRPGDMIITNDPYATNGLSTHLPDVHVFKPIFHEGRLICYAWAFVHTGDIGGSVPSSLTPAATDIQMEGLRVPPVWLYREGQPNRDVRSILLASSRMPALLMGDINSMVSAVNTAEIKLRELIGKFGADMVISSAADLMEQSERRARQIIEKIPDGAYRFEDYLDDDLESDVPIRIAVEVRVKGSDITLDFSNCDPQTATAFNLITNGSHHSYLYQGLINYIISEDPFIPVNGGLTYPIRIVAPEGTVVNALYPAAGGIRHPVSMRLYNAVLGALAQAIPEHVQAAGGGQAAIVVLSVPDETQGGAYKANVVEPMGGGGGGQMGMDGVHGIDHASGFLKNTPIESLEKRTNILVHRYELIPDSAGAGLYRGGSAIRLDFEILKEGSLVGARGQERLRFQPWGLCGGKAGVSGSVVINPDTARAQKLPKIKMLAPEKGDIVSFRSPGGGGWGDPFQRPAALVLEDVSTGLLSVRSAEADYGVAVVKTGSGCAVDEDRTAALRKNAPARRDVYDLGGARQAYESVWTRQASDALAQKLLTIPVSRRSHCKHQIHEALREKHRPLTARDIEDAWALIIQNGEER